VNGCVARIWQFVPQQNQLHLLEKEETLNRRVSIKIDAISIAKNKPGSSNAAPPYENGAISFFLLTILRRDKLCLGAGGTKAAPSARTGLEIAALIGIVK
jgi:hypothetical protein